MSTLRQRKSPRLQGYDYSQEGAYFVTVCTHNRECLFGEVLEGEMHLNTLGNIAYTCWEQLPAHFPNIDLDAFVVMPNHVHGIIVIVEQVVGTRRTRYTSSLPSAAQDPQISAASSNRPKGVKPGSLGAVIASYKAAVTRQINRTQQMDSAWVWQERYHDHIIRSEPSLNIFREYTLHNPALWHKDTFYK